MKEDPGNPLVFLDMGRIARRANRREKGREHLGKSVPPRIRIPSMFSPSMFPFCCPKKSFSGHIQGLGFHGAESSDPRVYVVLGELEASRGMNAKAERHFRKAIELNQNAFSAYFRLANLYRKGKRYDAAIQQYREAIRRNPGFLAG